MEGCPKCRTDNMISNLSVRYDYAKIGSILSKDAIKKETGNIWKYKALLPVEDTEHMISLCEGLTPLIFCRNLGKNIGIDQLYVKDESRNPTWSFKDRSCCVGVAKGLDFHATVITIASTGNHGAAAAAYSARAGLTSVIFTVREIPKVQLTLMQIYGSKVVQGTFEGRWELMGRCVRELGWYPLSTYTLTMPTGNPYTVEGYKTIAYEICEQLNWTSPDKVLVPVSHGEGLFGIWKGFKEFHELGLIDRVPRMVSVEPEAKACLAEAARKKLSYPIRVPVKPTVAFHIGSSLCSYQALWTIKDSDGRATTVTEEEIIEAYLLLPKSEGIWSEPSSAATVAAAKRLRRDGSIDRDEVVVCVLTSTGLKDPDIELNSLPKPFDVTSDWGEFKKSIGEQ